jgi:hypothetical protein
MNGMDNYSGGLDSLTSGGQAHLLKASFTSSMVLIGILKQELQQAKKTSQF